MSLKLLLPVLAMAAAFPAYGRAADALPPRIVVMGEGEAKLAPDLAELSLSVMREAPTAREALSANNDAMAAVIAAMKSAGIAERDLQTAGIQIAPRYDYTPKQDGSQEARLVAYQVTNTLSVRVRDITKVGELLDKSVTLGVNQGGGIYFTNENPDAALQDARKRAVEDAVSKARTLAEAAGVTLGRVLEISETPYRQPPMPMAKYDMRAAAAEAAPIQPGENSYTVQVNLTYEIK